jgi:hypothetical protein
LTAFGETFGRGERAKKEAAMKLKAPFYNQATANDRRTITITITAPAEDFLLADPAGAAEGDSARRRRAQERRAGDRRDANRAKNRGGDAAETRPQTEGGERAGGRSESASEAGNGQRRRCGNVGIRKLNRDSSRGRHGNFHVRDGDRSTSLVAMDAV